VALSLSNNLWHPSEWKPIHAHDLILHLVCRASNRLFVGLPLCRDPQYTKISRDFSGTVIRGGFLINLFPRFLKPLVGQWFSAAPKAVKGFETYLVPVIEERWRLEREMGNVWDEKKPVGFPGVPCAGPMLTADWRCAV